jgi:hypothetical protein
MIIIRVQQISSKVMVPESHKGLTMVQYMQSHLIRVLTIHYKWQHQQIPTCISVVLSDSELFAVLSPILSGSYWATKVPQFYLEEFRGKELCMYVPLMDFQCSRGLLLLHSLTYHLKAPSEMPHAGSSPRNGVWDPCFTSKLASSLPHTTLCPGTLSVALCSVSPVSQEIAHSPRLSLIKSGSAFSATWLSSKYKCLYSYSCWTYSALYSKKVCLSNNSSIGKVTLTAHFHTAHCNSPMALAAYFCHYTVV